MATPAAVGSPPAAAASCLLDRRATPWITRDTGSSGGVDSKVRPAAGIPVQSVATIGLARISATVWKVWGSGRARRACRFGRALADW